MSIFYTKNENISLNYFININKFDKELFENLNLVIMNKKKQSPLDDEEFMVYELDYTGKRIKLDIKPEELQNYLNPERVLIII